MFHRKNTIALATTALAAALAIFAGPSEAASGLPITACGQTITTNAVLTQDLTCAGHGMFVGASGITIDLQGHTLKGNGSWFGISDVGGYDDVTVKNGVVRKFGAGIVAENGTDNLTVSNVVLSGNSAQGAVIEGDSASIVSSAASGNGSDGISVAGRAASVKSSTASGNGGDGIYVHGNDSTSITSSTAVGNGAYGVYVDADVSTKVKSSSAIGNAKTGFSLFGSGTSVSSSTAAGNAWDGFFIQGGSVSVTSTKVSGNALRGIRVFGDAARLKGNRAEGNGFPGGSSDGSGLGILVQNFTTPPVGTNVVRGNDDAVECSPASLCPSGSSTKAPATPITACDQYVSTSAVLTTDLNCAGVGIHVNSSGITIDLNGHVLRGNNSAFVGIANGGNTGVTIKNGTVRNFNVGVSASGGADNMTISNVVASGNNTGIYVDGTSASIRSSTASGNVNGMSISGDLPSITSSSADGNGGNGMYLYSDDPSITSSSALGNAANGILFKIGPAMVASSNVSGNGFNGIEVDNGESASIKSTTASGNGSHGMFLSGDALMLKGNRAEGNGFPGGVSDGSGLGIWVGALLTGPVSPNVVRGNDDPAGCHPLFC